jgi:hypothetical protein
MYEQADDHGYFDLPVEIYGNGLPETLTVCVNGACSQTPEDAFEGSEVGDVAGLQGYDTTYTVTAYVTDSAGRRAPATGTVSTTVTTPAAPAAATVAISQGQPTSGDPGYYAVHFTLADFPANEPIGVQCGEYGDLDNFDTDASGGASFDSHINWGGFSTSGDSLSCTVTVDGVSGSDTYTTP